MCCQQNDLTFAEIYDIYKTSPENADVGSALDLSFYDRK